VDLGLPGGRRTTEGSNRGLEGRGRERFTQIEKEEK
jgi:hypothetical protein